MKFEAKITLAAYKSFSLLAQKRIGEQRRFKTKYYMVTIIHWMLLGIAAAAMLNFYESCNSCNLSHLNVSVVFIVAWILAAFILQKWYSSVFIENSANDPGSILGNFTFELYEGGLSEERDGYKSSYTWNTITNIEKENNILFLFIDIAKAIIIPIENITDKQRQELLEILKEKLNYEL